MDNPNDSTNIRPLKPFIPAPNQLTHTPRRLNPGVTLHPIVNPTQTGELICRGCGYPLLHIPWGDAWALHTRALVLVDLFDLVMCVGDENASSATPKK